jgi:ribosomal protein S12 methylthiotransferase
MRGKHVSRPLDDILAEARGLTAQGVKELILIGQDTTSYGTDLYGRARLADVLDRLCDLEGVAWIRLMYAYPSQFPRDVLDVMVRNQKICKYLDIPIQHASDTVLKSMRRGMTRRALTDLLHEIRSRVPGIALRTTLIVGYPAEGPTEFDELVEFVRTTEFERLGVFTYSHEEHTPAFSLGDPVPSREKGRRRDVIMEMQREISEKKNEQLLGKRVRVLLDRHEEDLWYGRTEHDAPEIDNEVIIKADRTLSVGSFYDVEIVDSYEYDLHGRVNP